MIPPKRKALPVIGLATLAAVTALAYWPAPRPEVRQLERPERPPHPARIYTPPAVDR